MLDGIGNNSVLANVTSTQINNAVMLLAPNTTRFGMVAAALQAESYIQADTNQILLINNNSGANQTGFYFRMRYQNSVGEVYEAGLSYDKLVYNTPAYDRVNLMHVDTIGNADFAGFITSTSADTIASTAIIAPDAQNVVITGTANIDSIQTTNIPNFAIIYIEFTGTAATTGIVDGNNLKLEGNFVYTPDDMMVLQRRGIYFHEISRSIN